MAAVALIAPPVVAMLTVRLSDVMAAPMVTLPVALSVMDAALAAMALMPPVVVRSPVVEIVSVLALVMT